MGKNINPKSLKGKDKMGRIKNLMGRMNTLNESTSLSELELVKKGPNGVIYGIVRENHKYFIKTTEKQSGNLLAEDFNYVGGLQNKFDEAYNSYAEVTKQLNLKFDMLNESFGIEENNNIFETDGVAFDGGTGFAMEEVVIEAEEVDEQEYKLKVDAPAPIEEPAMDSEVGVEDEVEVDVETEEDFDEEPAMDDMGGEDDESDPVKKIQKMTGKIAQKIREMEDVDTDLEKYVINSVISALHLDQFSDEDIEDVISKLESEDEEDDMGAEDGGEELPLEEPEMEEEIIDEPEMAEESYKIKKGALVESLTKKIVKKQISEDYYGSMNPSPRKIRNAAKKWRNKKRLNAHHDMDMGNSGTYGKYDDKEYLMDEDFDIDGNDFMTIELDMDSDYVDCNSCGGVGCDHCDDKGYHLSNEFDNNDFMSIDGQTGEYGPYDRDGDGIASSVDMDADGDGYLDEMDGDGYGIDVLDSVSGSISDDFMSIDGQTGEYGPYDRDGDGIASSVDQDDDGDGYLDDEMGGDDLDITYFSSSEPATKPRTRPGVGDPVTTPGRKERKGPWTKPKTTPKPKAEEGETAPIERISHRRKGWYK